MAILNGGEKKDQKLAKDGTFLSRMIEKFVAHHPEVDGEAMSALKKELYHLARRDEYDLKTLESLLKKMTHVKETDDEVIIVFFRDESRMSFDPHEDGWGRGWLPITEDWEDE